MTADIIKGHNMRKLWTAFIALRRKAALTPAQAEQLAAIKFPCC